MMMDPETRKMEFNDSIVAFNPKPKHQASQPFAKLTGFYINLQFENFSSLLSIEAVQIDIIINFHFKNKIKMWNRSDFLSLKS